MMRFSVCIGSVLLTAVAACGARIACAQEVSKEKASAREAYAKLLAMFPEDHQGLGKDHYLLVTTEHQPMTYGLVLSAEAMHLRSVPNDESRRRVRLAARWLLDNSDLDRDGKPGWGLPQPWESFCKTPNPLNHPYTITTSIVLYGFLDALKEPCCLPEADQKAIRSLMANVAMRWCRHIWSEGFGGGYFWYSPNPCNEIFSINASSMFSGAMVRLLKEQGDALTAEERQLVEDRVDEEAKAVVATMIMRKGLPYWLYCPQPNKFNYKHSNDLLHHVYTLWGIETYRDYGGRVKLPWTRAQAIESVDRFVKDGQICALPQDVGIERRFKPLRLWDVGMILAFYGKWGQPQQSQQVLDAAEKMAPWPHLPLFPMEKTGDSSFYPRHAAHLLYGLSLYCFSP
ncbi:MAG: hypothetical protein ABFC77_03250 [Thermoguttaceae bacterium]